MTLPIAKITSSHSTEVHKKEKTTQIIAKKVESMENKDFILQITLEDPHVYPSAVLLLVFYEIY